MAFSSEPYRRHSFVPDKDYATEIGMPLYLKDVFVCDLSPEVKAFRSFKHFPQFLFSEVATEDGVLKHILLWSDGGHARPWDVSETKIKICWNFSRNSVQVRHETNLTGWSSSIVDCDWTKFKACTALTLPFRLKPNAEAE